MIKKKCVLFFVLSLCLFAPGGLTANLPVYTESDRVIILPQHQKQFIIRLSSNPTTGYRWFLNAYDQRSIKLLSHQYLPPKAKLIGAGGTEQWTFELTRERVLKPRQITIALTYARPWNQSDEPKKIIFDIR